jgi:hypothetical protein
MLKVTFYLSGLCSRDYDDIVGVVFEKYFRALMTMFVWDHDEPQLIMEHT